MTPETAEAKKPEKKIKAKGILVGNSVLVPNIEEAQYINQKGYFGDFDKSGSLNLAIVEALYLIDKKRLEVKDGKKKLGREKLLKAGEKHDPNIFYEFVAYTDLRDRGYTVKTGFKFGAHFRIYKRGEIPGQAHSAFMVHAVPEYFNMTMTELSRIVRLGHSVKKKMWIAVVDNEGDLTYYQLRRIKP